MKISPVGLLQSEARLCSAGGLDGEFGFQESHRGQRQGRKEVRAERLLRVEFQLLRSLGFRMSHRRGTVPHGDRIGVGGMESLQVEDELERVARPPDFPGQGGLHLRPFSRWRWAAPVQLEGLPPPLAAGSSSIVACPARMISACVA